MKCQVANIFFLYKWIKKLHEQKLVEREHTYQGALNESCLLSTVLEIV